MEHVRPGVGEVCTTTCHALANGGRRGQSRGSKQTPPGGGRPTEPCSVAASREGPEGGRPLRGRQTSGRLHQILYTRGCHQDRERGTVTVTALQGHGAPRPSAGTRGPGMKCHGICGLFPAVGGQGVMWRGTASRVVVTWSKQSWGRGRRWNQGSLDVLQLFCEADNFPNTKL